MQYQECKVPRVLSIRSLYTFFRRQYEADFRFEGEAHDFWEVVYVAGGGIGVTGDKRIYVLEEGQLIFHPPMEFHKIWSERSTCPEIIIFSFRAEEMPVVAGPVHTLKPDQRDWLERLYALSRQTLETEDMHVRGIKPGREFEAQRLVSGMEQLLLSILAGEAEQESVCETESARSYGRIISVMEKNLARSLSLEELADLCGMGVSSLKKTFFRYAGMGVIRYFNLMKVNRGKQLLKEGHSVKETAFLLGFSDQNYFSTVFRRLAGAPPKEFKNTFSVEL